jgi:S-adenosylmethionine decarboxylase|tara:strand:+ start:1895 stop:2290 length:396 start_codon:yes stop_codon:yes gene_type:complete
MAFLGAMPWGYHALFDCRSCPIERVTSEENIREFINEIVSAIDMKSYGEPMIAHFATHDADASGYSFCQMIETSNITGHFSDKTGDCYIDVFSCKEYDTDVAAGVIDDFFRPEEVKMRYFKRGDWRFTKKG